MAKRVRWEVAENQLDRRKEGKKKKEDKGGGGKEAERAEGAIGSIDSWGGIEAHREG